MFDFESMSMDELEEIQESLAAAIEAKQETEREQEKKDVEELFIKGVVRDETKAAYTMEDIIKIALREDLLKIYFRTCGQCEPNKLSVYLNEDFSISVEIDDCDLY